MGPLDPRLVHRAGAVRMLLALDAALGVVAALLVLAQAVLIGAVAGLYPAIRASRTPPTVALNE